MWDCCFCFITLGLNIYTLSVLLKWWTDLVRMMDSRMQKNHIPFAHLRHSVGQLKSSRCLVKKPCKYNQNQLLYAFVYGLHHSTLPVDWGQVSKQRHPLLHSKSMRYKFTIRNSALSTELTKVLMIFIYSHITHLSAVIAQAFNLNDSMTASCYSRFQLTLYANIFHVHCRPQVSIRNTINRNLQTFPWFNVEMGVLTFLHYVLHIFIPFF